MNMMQAFFRNIYPYMWEIEEIGNNNGYIIKANQMISLLHKAIHSLLTNEWYQYKLTRWFPVE